MNAKEAREWSLWKQLDSYIREQIEREVNAGYTSASIYHFRPNVKDINNLIDLGYSITFEDGTTIIKW